MSDGGFTGTPYAFVGSTDGFIRTFAVNLATGALTAVSQTDGGIRPSFLAISPDRRFLYAANETNVGTISAFTIGDGGVVGFINSQSSQGSGPAHVGIDHTGRWVFSSNYGSGDVAVLPVVDGGLQPFSAKDKPGTNAHQMVIDNSNRYVFVPCKGSDVVAQYLFNADAGTLTANAVPDFGTDAGAGPRHLAFHPTNEQLAYLVNELNSTIQALLLTRATGRLSAIQPPLSTLPAGFTGQNTGAEVQVHPNGKFVYASNRGHDSIAIFSSHPQSGALTLVGHQSTGGQKPRMFSIDPTGRWLYVGNETSNAINLFEIDGTSGLLSPRGVVANLPAPQFIEVVFLP